VRADVVRGSSGGRLRGGVGVVGGTDHDAHGTLSGAAYVRTHDAAEDDAGGAYTFTTAAAPCPGDLDGDGDTDLSDPGILLADWNCGT
jgi:hypothetical protein